MEKIDIILSDSAFDCFDEGKKALIKQMYGEMQGRPPETALLIFQKYAPAIFPDGGITAEQRDAMLRALTADMSEADKRRLNTILKLLKM